MIPSKEKLRSLLARAEKSAVSKKDLAWLPALIDHTLLKPDAREKDIIHLCEEANEFGFATVCVYPVFIPLCRRILKPTIKPIAVIGFPTGNVPTATKVSEAADAIAKGALEIDMVLQVAKLKKGKLRSVYLDIRKVVLACGKIPVKVILETCLLNDDEKRIACGLAKAAGAAFVKTSTGFSSGGATTADIEMMRRIVGPRMGVKASGGIRTLPDALRMILAGANRIGASAGVSIVSGNSGHKAPDGVY